MSKRLIGHALAAASLVSFLGVSANAVTVFDFEDQTATPFPDMGVLTSLPMVKDGITATVTREFGKRFDVRDETVGFEFPPILGNHVLSPFFDTAQGSFIVDFSTPMSDISLLVGDLQPSDADDMTLNAYAGAGGTGALVGSVTESLPLNTGSGWLFKSMSLSGLSGASSIVLQSVATPGDFPYSVFVDNITVTAVPEPASAGLLLGVPMLLAARRRRA